MRVSVVVPSHQRAHVLPVLLAALAGQDRAADEVIVSLDGCTDGSADVARRFGAEVVGGVRGGAGAARNRGAAVATGDLLLFLDDDVEPEPDLVARHVAHHERRSGRVVVGDCPVVRDRPGDEHHVVSWGWWEEFNHERGRPDAERTYRDVCTGNLSLRRSDFERLGGFDERFAGYGGEDWELGHRLLRAGLEVVVDTEALARHRPRHRVQDMLGHRRSEGRADVVFARAHPDVTRGLRLATQRVVEDAFTRPSLVRARIERDVVLMEAARRTSRMRRWHHLRSRSFADAYWLGVAGALDGRPELDDLLRAAGPIPREAVDVADGLPERVPLPAHLPGVLVVHAGAQRLGEVELPAFTPRRRSVVAPLIAKQLGDRLLAAPALSRD